MSIFSDPIQHRDRYERAFMLHALVIVAEWNTLGLARPMHRVKRSLTAGQAGRRDVGAAPRVDTLASPPKSR